MKTFWISVVLTMMCSISLAGGGDYRDMPQQQMAPPVVIVPQPAAKDDSSPLVPIAVAALSAVGLVGAAYVAGGGKKAD